MTDQLSFIWKYPVLSQNALKFNWSTGHSAYMVLDNIAFLNFH